VRRLLPLLAASVLLGGGCGGQEAVEGPPVTGPAATSAASVPAQTSASVLGTQATEVQLAAPEGLAFDAEGNLYISEFEDTVVVKLDSSGALTTIATDISGPAGLAFNAEGHLFVADHYNNGIVRVDPAGAVVIVAGTGTDGSSGDGGPAIAAELSFPTGIAFDGDGNLYLSDADNNRVRKVDPAGVIATVAGTGAPGFSGDGGPATAAELDAPAGLAVSADGRLYIADQGNDRVRRIDRDGVITTVAGGGT
jgi:serine/threonine-protein kinase